MEKLIHDEYLEPVIEILNIARSYKGDKAKFIQESPLPNVSESIWRVKEETETIDLLTTDLIAAHVYMAKSFEHNKNVYMLERELALSLLHTGIKAHVSDLKFPFNSFILYPNVGYGDVGFPEFDAIHKIECVHFKMKDEGDLLSFYLADVLTNLKDAKSTDSKRRANARENTCYTVLTLPKEKLFERDILSNMVRREENRVKYVGQDASLDTPEFSEAFYTLRDRMLVLVLSLGAYLAMEQDEEIIVPEWTPQKVAKITNPKKKRRAEKALQNEGGYPVRYIGRKYQKTVQERLVKAGLPKDYKYQIKVPGHFNYYWYGKRKDEHGNRVKGQVRKPVWLEPQIKLPELPEREKATIYKVK